MSAAERAGDAGTAPDQVAALLRHRAGFTWLDGGDTEPSILVWEPDAVHTDVATWASFAARTPFRTGPMHLPFVSGYVGYVGYGAGPSVAPVPSSAAAWEPDVWLAHYPGALVFDPRGGVWWATGSDARRAEATALLSAARPLPPLPPADGRDADDGAMDEAAFVAAVRRVLGRIADGDVYQLNLTRTLTATGVGDAFDAYRRIRAASRPDRAAYLTLDAGVTVASNSPERLLDAVWDGAAWQVSTCPIKGTRPRTGDPVCDARHRAELEASEKERAELTMIVDLCRNDLGRVAVPGTVHAGPRHLTEHANVFHAEAVVSATLTAALGPWDALAALFPPGSVTGAPKVRACQRIAELELTPRGVYCGAIGFVSDHGRAAWNVAIRTAVLRPRGDGTLDARWHVGGGIVADSDPHAEWEETRTKGSVLRAALVGDQ